MHTWIMELADGWGYLPLAIGLGMILLVLVAYLRKQRQSRLGAWLTPHEQLEQIEQKKAVRDDLGQLMVEIERMAGRVSQQVEQVDAKLVRMEQLIQQADRCIARMETMAGELDRKPSQASPDRFRPDAGQRAPSSSDQPDDPLSQSVYALADQGISSDQIARQLNEHVGKVELILALRSA